MKRDLPRVLVVMALAVLLTGCTITPKASSISSGTPSESPSPSPSGANATGCPDVYMQILLGAASNSGTSPTPLVDPAQAGYPRFVAKPDCAILWTNKNGLPSYGGIYINATDDDFSALLASAQAGSISTATQPPQKGMSRFELLGEETNGTTSSAGVLVMLNSVPAIGLSSPTIMFEWDRLLF